MQGARFRGPGSGFQASVWVLGFGFQVFCFGFCVSGLLFRGLGFRSSVSGYYVLTIFYYAPTILGFRSSVQGPGCLKALRLLYHSTLGSIIITKRRGAGCRTTHAGPLQFKNSDAMKFTTQHGLY